MALAISGPYQGYRHGEVPEPYYELTRVGPGSPGGEYLRRFWHPVYLTAELRDLPRRIRILGEDLVLFRDGRGQIGLLELHCSHRGTSLEFGMVERCGIRCCYHGWLYDVDGRVLETPGEPAGSTFKDRFYHGAYPVHEYNGLIFTYMGPPERRPAFPVYDTWNLPGYRMVASGITDEQHMYDCNWIQLAENNTDGAHAQFLHGPEFARMRLDNYRPSANAEATLADYFNVGLTEEYHQLMAKLRDDYRARVSERLEVPGGTMSAQAHRAGEYVWLRISDYIFPNIDQRPHYYRRDTLEEFDLKGSVNTTWTVPVDDTHTVTFSFDHCAERSTERVRPRGEHPLRTSDSLDRSYEDRQRVPGDYEAQGSQRPIAVHALEHLGTTDLGVTLIRKGLKEGIRVVQQGGDPGQKASDPASSIRTHARIAIVPAPPATTPEADRELLQRILNRYVATSMGKPPHPPPSSRGRG